VPGTWRATHARQAASAGHRRHVATAAGGAARSFLTWIPVASKLGAWPAHKAPDTWGPSSVTASTSARCPMYRGAVTGSIVALVAVGSGATCEICWQYIGSAERKNRHNRRSEAVRDTGIEPVDAPSDVRQMDSNPSGRNGP